MKKLLALTILISSSAAFAQSPAGAPASAPKTANAQAAATQMKFNVCRAEGQRQQLSGLELRVFIHDCMAK
jgi:hypothetical protein